MLFAICTHVPERRGSAASSAAADSWCASGGRADEDEAATTDAWAADASDRDGSEACAIVASDAVAATEPTPTLVAVGGVISCSAGCMTSAAMSAGGAGNAAGDDQSRECSDDDDDDNS